MPGVEEVEENKSLDVGAAPFSPFLPAAGIAAGTGEDADAEQQRKRERRGAGWDVGVGAEHKQERLPVQKWCKFVLVVHSPGIIFRRRGKKQGRTVDKPYL